jgi:hypothetical protein
MTCGGFTSAALTGGLTAWAQCWFILLMILVIVTVAVLFIIGMLALVRL